MTLKSFVAGILISACILSPCMLNGCGGDIGPKGPTLEERIGQIGTTKPVSEQEVAEIYQTVLMEKANMKTTTYRYESDRINAIKRVNGCIRSFNAARIHLDAEQGKKYPEIIFYESSN